MTSAHKQWISVKADGRLVAALDREAEARGVSRSEAIREAVREWTRRAVEEDEERLMHAEERHRQILRPLEYIVGMIRRQEQAVGLTPERGRKRLTDDPSAGPADGYAPRKERDVQQTEESEDGTRRSALAEARKRARRRVQ